jgi:hypothetical protein
MKRESSAHTVKLVFLSGGSPPNSSEPAVGAQKKLPGNAKFVVTRFPWNATVIPGCSLNHLTLEPESTSK